MYPSYFDNLPSFFKSFFFKGLLIGFLILFILYGVLISPPQNYPENDMVVIPRGASISTTAYLLQSRGIIRSRTLFSVFVMMQGERGVIAGGYLFDRPQTVLRIAQRLAKGDHKLNSIRVTFAEGLSNDQLADLCAKTLPLCKKAEFLERAKGSEGYLFPDTYFFLQSTDAAEVVDTLKETFTRRLAPLDKEIRSFGKSKSDIVIMASILEKEGQNFENRVNIASILWKRIGIGMPLQADATLDFALNKNTYELTLKDLATTSPYNTYKYKGLPPTPITNPGLESIKAALSAKPTKYIFYLTSRGGTFYYAETFEKHLENKARYLNALD